MSGHGDVSEVVLEESFADAAKAVSSGGFGDQLNRRKDTSSSLYSLISVDLSWCNFK